MRNRHGRGRRGVLIPRSLPGHLTPRLKFELCLRDALRAAARIEPVLEKMELAYDDVPNSDPTEWEGAEPILCRAFRANVLRGTRPRIVFYRLPLMQTGMDEGALKEMIEQLALTQARALSSEGKKD